MGQYHHSFLNIINVTFSEESNITHTAIGKVVWKERKNLKYLHKYPKNESITHSR